MVGNGKNARSSSFLPSVTYWAAIWFVPWNIMPACLASRVFAPSCQMRPAAPLCR